LLCNTHTKRVIIIIIIIIICSYYLSRVVYSRTTSLPFVTTYVSHKLLSIALSFTLFDVILDIIVISGAIIVGIIKTTRKRTELE